jgi:hypothetical protein
VSLSFMITPTLDALRSGLDASAEYGRGMAVVGVHEGQAEQYAGGRSFGEAGPATLRRFRLDHAVDPGAGANGSIVDLALAGCDESGRVRFDHDLIVVQPLDPGTRNGWALVDIANRGAVVASSSFQMDDSPMFPPPQEPPAGDGHLLEHGWTVVFAGWQFDIDDPTMLGLRAPTARQDGRDVRGPVSYVLRCSIGGDRLPLAMPGQGVWPVSEGTGSLYEDDVLLDDDEWEFAADARALLRPGGFTPGCFYRCEYETTGPLVGGCGLLALRDIVPWLRREEGISRALLFGVSQSGRVIRQFLHDGMNIDEEGQQVYDAVMPVIAGARRGHFNERFTIPGAMPSASDEIGDKPRYGSLLGRSGASSKVMAINTSTEYWRGDTAELHGDAHPDVRVHHIAGAKHGPGTLPQTSENLAFGLKALYGFNTIDYRPVLRALLRQVIDWVDNDIAPSPGTTPTDAQMTTREIVLAQFASVGLETPRLQSFIQPPGPVPAVDAVGNEIGGIRLPDVAVPVGVHAGWNLRHPDLGAPEDELFLSGSTWWFEQIPELSEYLEQVREVVADLVGRRLILEADAPLVIDRAEASWRDTKQSAARRFPAA